MDPDPDPQAPMKAARALQLEHFRLMIAMEDEAERQSNSAVPASERPRFYRPNCMLEVIKSKSVHQMSRFQECRYDTYDRALRCSLVHLKVVDGTPSFYAFEDNPFRRHLWLRSLEVREVEEGVARSLCPHNAILLCLADFSHESLDTLLSPSVDLFRWLKRLDLYLEMTSDHTGLCDANCMSCLTVSDFHPVTLPACERRSTKMVDFIPTWSRFWDCLAHSACSHELELKLMCDVPDARAARTILQPLQSVRLAKCAIRLQSHPNAELKSVARHTVLHVTRSGLETGSHFRFLDLPPELRRHVLSFTDLITPEQEISWQPTSFRLHDSNIRRMGHTWTANRLCSQVYAAFPLCECWEPPTPMFLVCRAMLQDARAVFYSSNRFIILKQGYRDGESGCTNGLEATVFLRTTHPDALRYLRDLEIVFQPTGYSSPTIEPHILEEWKDSISYAGQYLRKLKLAMIFGEEKYPDLFMLPADARASEDEQLSVQEKIVRPVAQLKCLAAFYVQVSLCSVYSYDPPHNLEPQERRQETHLRNIVSRSTSGNAIPADPERKPSRWTTDRDPQCAC